MLTFKFKIKSCSDIDLVDLYNSNYTDMFYKIYNNFNYINDNEYIKSLLENSTLDKSMFEMCLTDVKTKKKQQEIIVSNKEKKIKDIDKYLKTNVFKTKKERFIKYKYINKLSYLKRTLNKDIVFGGKDLLREITKLSQIKDKTLKQIDLLKRKKDEFTSNRKLGVYLIGRSCECGNRKVDFNLENRKIVFKPSKEFKIDIEFFNNSNKIQNTLNKLQHLTDLKLIPLTVRITNTHITISYDEEFLNGYSFNQKDCKEEQTKHVSTDEKKLIFIKYKKEQEDRKTHNKLINRYLSVDLNPQFIGYSIFDDLNGEMNLIVKGCFDLSGLNTKLNLSSLDLKQKKQNNKRKHEIIHVWKQIFKLVKHYKVYNFVMEDLNFNTNINDKNTLFNRQTKNLWYRTLTTNQIKKNCNEIGLNLIEVNPCYSSFIGNMIYNFFDPTSSSIEIGRRGLVKYKKGCSIYPDISKINQEKLFYLLGENVDIQGFNWIQLYKTTNRLRYRNPLNDKGLVVNNLMNINSKVKVYSF